MSFATTTERYEHWLDAKLDINRDELKEKRRRMQEDEHSFLRGTFYRWAVLWQKHCPECDRAPSVLGVGDLHVENFGTWRDADGRLAWGVNDFDEACTLPYTNDLVRLATSAILALSEANRRKLTVRTTEEICNSILAGYREGLEHPEPFVLAERHAWLRHIVAAMFEPKNGDGKSRYTRFIEQMSSLPPATRVKGEVAEILRDAFPRPIPVYALGHRSAGLGSLGRQRFTAVANDWYGGILVREVKAVTTSSWLWALGQGSQTTIHYNRIIKAALRAPDPTLQVRGGWVIRRLAPDVGKVELQDMPLDTGEDLLRAMGKETANVHAPTGESLKAVLKDLDQRPPTWLADVAVEMRQRIRKDWEELKDAG